METRVETTKTVVKPIQTIVCATSDFINLLYGIRSATIFEMVQITEPKDLRKTNNPFYDKGTKRFLVEKVSKINGMFATDYERGVQKASGDSSFEAQDHKWAIHYRDSKVVMINRKEEGQTPTKYYAAFRPLRADEVSYRWMASKVELTEEEVKTLKTFKPEKNSGPIEWRTVTVDNIREIRMGGLRYLRG